MSRIPRPNGSRILIGYPPPLERFRVPNSGSTSFEVGNGWNQAGFQGLHGENIFDPRTHGVAGLALSVGNDDLIGGGPRIHGATRGSRRRRRRARGRIGLMRNKDRM